MAERPWKTQQRERGHKSEVLEHVSLPQFLLEEEGLDVCTGENSSPLGTANENLKATFCHGVLQPYSMCPAIPSCCLQMSRDNQCVHRAGDSGWQRVPEVWISPAPCPRLPQSIPSCTSCSLFALKGQSLLPAKAFPPWQGFHEADGGEIQESEVSPPRKMFQHKLVAAEGSMSPPPLAVLSPNSFFFLPFFFN